MVYHGRIEKGVVVLDGEVTLPEGLRVRVEEAEPEERIGSIRAILDSGAHWHGTAEEMDQLLQDLKDMKWAEVRKEEGRQEGAA